MSVGDTFQTRRFMLGEVPVWGRFRLSPVAGSRAELIALTDDGHREFDLALIDQNWIAEREREVLREFEATLS